MSRNLVLHIGLPKTGSTSIQRALASRRREFRQQGLYYPRVREGSVPQHLHKVDHSLRADQFWRELIDEIAAVPQDGSTVILSAEQCGRALREAREIAALHARLADYFTSMRVVVYLRRQDLHAASLFAQRLRTGRVLPPDMASFADEMAPMHDYDALLNRWSEIFGAAAMVPRIYQRDCLPGGDVVRDFLEICGLDPTWVAERAEVQTNPSMNLEGQIFLLGIRGWLQQQSDGAAIDSVEWAALSALATRCCPGRGWRPHQAEAAAYLAGFAASNEAVRRRWFPARPSLFDMDMRDLPEAPLVLAPHPAPETIYAAVMDLVRAAPGAKKTAAKKKRKKGEKATPKGPKKARPLRAKRRARLAAGTQER